MPTVAQLMKALPDYGQVAPLLADTADHRENLAMSPVPVGRMRRLGLLGTLQAQIAAAYAFYWVRGWFKNADERQKLLAETHWRTAIRLLDSMGYLRGAAMKVGQTLANFPDIVPREFVETLDQLHFDAPPMHWSLLREMVINELGDDPENLFASFERRAFAAASLGQVHRAQLKSGEQVAVKIQYPGIARTIREDIRNLAILMLPARLGRDWKNTKEQIEDLRMRLERETDYELETSNLEQARLLFREDDGILVPRVYSQFSTASVLTMERLGGVHIDGYLSRGPAQAERNEFARKIWRAWYRMMYAGRLLYLDFHPGNFLFLDDGRLGVIDFGNLTQISDDLWGVYRRMDRGLTTGSRDDRIEFIKEWTWVTDEANEADRLRVGDEFMDWNWQPRCCGRDFDFGDEAYFRRGVDLMTEGARKRYNRGQPISPMIIRQQFGLFALMYRLKAKIDIHEIAEEEVRATGWDRSEYASP